MPQSELHVTRPRGAAADGAPETTKLERSHRAARGEAAPASDGEIGATSRSAANALRRPSPTGAELSALQADAASLPVPRTRPEPVVTIREITRVAPAELTANRPQRLTLEVDPPELGRCELELSLRDGRVRATVIADRPETVLMMRAVEGQVREQLAARNMQVTEFDVRGAMQGAGQEGSGQSGFHGGRDREAAVRMPPRTPAEPAAVREAPDHGQIGRNTIDLVA